MVWEGRSSLAVPSLPPRKGWERRLCTYAAKGASETKKNGNLTIPLIAFRKIERLVPGFASDFTLMTTNRTIPTVELEAINDQILSQLKIDRQLTLITDVINNSGRDLVIITRTGLRFTIPSQRSTTDRSIFFREGFEMDGRVDVALNPSDVPFDPERSSAERLLASINKEMSMQAPYRSKKATRIAHCLPASRLVESGGTAYIAALDVVVSFHVRSNAIYHPFSLDGTLAAMRAMEFDDVSLRIGLYIVDNRNSRTDRYINWQGRVLRVPCRALPSMADGFYVVHPRPSLVGGVDTEYVAHHMSLEEAEKQYGLYRTPEEAETYGFSKEALERENLKLKREATQRSFERDETTEQRKERLRFEQEDASFRKIKQEEKAAFRKDILDACKWILGILTVCGAISSTIVKLKTGSK